MATSNSLWRWLTLSGLLLSLTGCVKEGTSPFSLLVPNVSRTATTGPEASQQEFPAKQNVTVAVHELRQEEDEDEDEEEDEEGSDSLEVWLQAYLYRSPDYHLSLPQKRNRLSEALRTAFDLRGTPYRIGGTSAQGLDCSGLVWVSFASAGIKLPRSSQEQFYATERIPKEALQPGDLVFFKTGRNKKRHIDHVGIYVGNGQFLHAPRRGKAVTLASLSEDYWQARYRGAGRIPGLQKSGPTEKDTTDEMRLVAAQAAASVPLAAALTEPSAAPQQVSAPVVVARKTKPRTQTARSTRARAAQTVAHSLAPQKKTVASSSSTLRQQTTQRSETAQASSRRRPTAVAISRGAAHQSAAQSSAASAVKKATKPTKRLAARP